MAITEIAEIKSIMPYLLKHKNLWANYDEGADVLYLHFTKPNVADDSEQVDENTIVRYDAVGEVIGVTILNASEGVQSKEPLKKNRKVITQGSLNKITIIRSSQTGQIVKKNRSKR